MGRRPEKGREVRGWVGEAAPTRGPSLHRTVQASTVLASAHRLVIQILRVLGLGEKHPALGDQRRRLQY